MGDNINMNNNQTNDIRDGHKELLLNALSQKVSYLTLQMMENDCIDVTHYYYYVRYAIEMFKDLDEVLRLNIDNIESYELTSVDYLEGEKYSDEKEFHNTSSYFYYNTPYIKVSHFDSVFADSKYKLYTDGYPGEVNYILKNPITVKDALEKNIGLVSFRAKPCAGYRENLYVIKDYFNNGLYIEEGCWTGKQVMVDIYDIKGAIARREKNYINDSNPEDTVIPPFPLARRQFGSTEAKRPWFLKESDIMYRIIIENSEKYPDVYDLTLVDQNNNVKREKLTGTSLYSAFYDYMVKEGYYKENSNEKEIRI